ncbi:MAG: thioredoxin domain-containing protein [Calditrichia bacterium]
MSHTNRLFHESSPYLRQHAHNPVDWYPWGEEAFEKARQENKLIFLSIGYSACHWCHVMAHESFENDSIAAYLNEHFVSIKVDREEHPDVDHLYQSFVQMTTGQGGWPLTVFLMPDLTPIYGGTYFPSTPRYGRISFPELLRRIQDVYLNEPEKIRANIGEISRVLEEINRLEGESDLPRPQKTFAEALRHLQSVFDPAEGGFSPAPKFPHTPDISYLFTHYFYEGNAQTAEMALFTLRKMANGGIYDQIGGGFHRYSTDAKWLVPHFEKMLYDNALLIPLYTRAYLLSGDPFFLQIAEETAAFVLRELRHPNGLFSATLDADSEGREGAFYVWDYSTLQKTVPKDWWEPFCYRYDIRREGNFEGQIVLAVKSDLTEVARRFGHEPDETAAAFAEIRKKLFEFRSARVRPGLDDKVLTDWNGMMVAALWELSRATGNSDYSHTARECLLALQEFSLTENGEVLHTIKQPDNQKIPGLLDDYAWVIKALLEGYENIGETDFLKTAVRLAEQSIREFGNSATGGFYYTSGQSGNLPVRLTQKYDSSTPAGIGVMTGNLIKLSTLTGKPFYREYLEKSFAVFKSELENQPAGLFTLLEAYLQFYHHPVELVINLPRPDKETDLMPSLRQLFIPARVEVRLQPNSDVSLLDPNLLSGRQATNQPTLFICHKGVCSLPITAGEQILAGLKELGLNVNLSDSK